MRLWDAQISGHLGGNGAQAAILETKETSLGASLNVHFLGYNSTFEYQPLSYSTRLNVQSAFRFENQSFGVGEQVLFDFDWDSLKWETRLLKLGEETLRVDLLGGLQVTDLRADVFSTTTGRTAQVDETLPFPVLGAQTEMALTERMSLAVQASWFQADWLGHSLHYLETDVGLRISLLESSDALGSFILGYRSRDVEATLDQGDPQEAHLDLMMDGPYAALRWQF